MAMATMPDMKHRPGSSRLLLIALVVLIFFVGGLILLFSRSNQGTAGAAAPAEAKPVVLPAFADASDTLLVWVGNGAAPGQHSASSPGELAFMDGTGVTTSIMALPGGTSRVELCGDQATSPDGRMVALFVGQDTGNLYLMKGTDTPTPIDDVEALTCLGGGTFQYSPDSARLGYIAYEPGAAQSEFADGFLHVVNTADLSEAFTAENVIAFDMTAEGAAYVSFFTNDKGEADEAAVNWWSGNASVEVATLQPNSEDCKFTSAQIAVAATGNYVVILGHRCTTGDTRTAWQLYSVNPDERSATLAASDFQAGSYASFARSNSIFLSPDGTRAYFTVADGITANTVGLKMVDLGDMSLVDVIERQAVMPTYNGAANAFPQLSLDGTWLAFVLTSPNNTNTLELLNLADPSVAPILLDAQSEGDTISSFSFTPDGTRLILVQGGDNAADNSLVAIDLVTGNDFRISRGRFGQGLVISPSGGEVALLDWKVLEDPQEPPYSTTLIVNVDNSETATVYTGAEIVDGKVTNQTFIYPLVWRRAGGTEAAASS
jgi:hypothetical protein